MPVFQYEALDAQGNEVKNEIEALSNKEAISKIRNLGYFPTKVRSRGSLRQAAAKAVGQSRKKRGAGGRVKIKILTQFARQLATLQDAGLSILRSLKILEQQQKGNFKRILGYVSEDIEGGSTLSEALGKYPKAFNDLFVNMVAAGEAGGVLDVILGRVADFMEKAERLKAKIKGAMIYPVVVMGAALVIVLGLMLFVIPRFSEVLKDMTGNQLPPLTQVLLDISNWLAKEWGWAIVIAVPFVIVFIIKLIRRFRVGRLILDTIALKMPIMGQIVYKTSVTRWTRTLGTLITAGVPILEGIGITQQTAGNEVYANMLGKVHQSIRQGDTFANPLKQSKTVDILVVNMVDVGEETGDLDKMLLKVADNFEEEVDVLVDGLMSLLEPVMIITLGSIIGVIVLAIFMPMVSIITSLSG